MEIFFPNEYSITVKVMSAAKGKTQVQKVVLRPGGDFKFQTKTWYFIAITHSSHFIRATEVTLHVNGKKMAACSLSYPKIDEVKPFLCMVSLLTFPFAKN